MQHQRESAVPQLKKKIKEINKTIIDMGIDEKIMERFQMEDELRKLNHQK